LSSSDVGLVEPEGRVWALALRALWARATRLGHISKLAKRDAEQCRHGRWPAHSRRWDRAGPNARPMLTCGRKGGSLWLTRAALVTLIFGSSATSQQAIARAGQYGNEQSAIVAGAVNFAAAVPADEEQPRGAPAGAGGAMNRLSNFPSSFPPADRRAWLDRGIAAVTSGRSPPLDVVEQASAVTLLQSDSDTLVRERLWQLLANSPRYELAVALAQQVLVDPNYFPRWSAFQYLRQVEPQVAETLAQHPPSAQTDARLLYVIADSVRPKDRQRWFALMMEALLAVGTDHEAGDLVSLALAREGGATELAELRRRDQIAGGHTAYSIAAEMLTAELARKPAPARKSSP
jgi:hypothetical protein